jgi:hypothetical protein
MGICTGLDNQWMPCLRKYSNVRRKIMKHLNTSYTTFDKLRFPKTVYKYREAENSKHLTILTEQIVFFAPPESFEDKLDCKIPVRYDLLTDEEIYDKYYNDLKDINPTWDSIYLRNQAILWCNHGLLKDKTRMEELEKHFWNEFNKRFGVLSLTAINDNLLMWNKYASNFNGFCIGLDPKVAFRNMGGGGQVDYVPHLPIIKPFDKIEDIGLTQSLTKLEKWAFEKEYRVQKIWPHQITEKERKFKIDPTAYTEIIIGNKVNMPTKEQLIDLARKLNPKIKINIAEKIQGKVSLKSFA